MTSAVYCSVAWLASQALAWSYDLLAPEEQQFFRRFAVFVDGGAIEAAEQVCQAAGSVQTDLLDGLDSLVDKSREPLLE